MTKDETKDPTGPKTRTALADDERCTSCDGRIDPRTGACRCFKG